MNIFEVYIAAQCGVFITMFVGLLVQSYLPR